MIQKFNEFVKESYDSSLSYDNTGCMQVLITIPNTRNIKSLDELNQLIFDGDTDDFFTDEISTYIETVLDDCNYVKRDSTSFYELYADSVTDEYLTIGCFYEFLCAVGVSDDSFDHAFGTEHVESLDYEGTTEELYDYLGINSKQPRVETLESGAVITFVDIFVEDGTLYVKSVLNNLHKEQKALHIKEL